MEEEYAVIIEQDEEGYRVAEVAGPDDDIYRDVIDIQYEGRGGFSGFDTGIESG